MEKKKLLIADQSEEFQQALQKCLHEDFDIKLCCEGYETLRVLESFQPDLLVMDMLLPGLDGLSILKELKSQPFEPTVLAIIRYCSDYLLCNLEALQVGYAMVKPCNIQAVANCLRELAMPCREVMSGDVEAYAKRMMLELRFPAHLRGYPCLQEALIEAVQNPGQQMKYLYITAARRCGGNIEQIEKAIRDVIKKGWEHCDDTTWVRYFGVDQNGVPVCPANNVCICTLAEHIRVQMMQPERYFSKIG